MSARDDDGELVRQERVGELVGRVVEPALDTRQRSRALAELSRLLAEGARSAGAGAALSGRALSDLVQQVAPHLPVRDVPTLSLHHGGHSGEELAQDLIRTAARTTAAIGAAGGALTALQTAAPPTLLAAPVQVMAETLAIVAVEIKLTAELHVVFGRAPLAPMPQVATAYLVAWSSRRGIDPSSGLPVLGSVLSVAARQQLRRRLTRRLGRQLSTLAPFLAGALAGAELNRRETSALGRALLADLRPSWRRPS